MHFAIKAHSHRDKKKQQQRNNMNDDKEATQHFKHEH